jgi:hypothetical protein
MNLAELERRLASSGVPQDAYCLSGGLPNEAYCIEKSSGKWQVYYSERGSQTGLKSFDTEDEAWAWLLESLTGKDARKES